jgi:hypothetical protein
LTMSPPNFRLRQSPPPPNDKNIFNNNKKLK